jgi:hypothetical protein
MRMGDFSGFLFFLTLYIQHEHYRLRIRYRLPDKNEDFHESLCKSSEAEFMQ